MGDSKVYFQGLEGSHSHQASKDIFPDLENVGYKSFESAVKAVTESENDFVVLPVENTAAGRVMEVHNIMRNSGLFIIKEYLLPISHHLMIPRKAFRNNVPSELNKEEASVWKKSDLTEEEIKEAFDSVFEIHSHPQALAQCTQYIQKRFPKALPIPEFDTAAAARDISIRDDCRCAAIASASASEIYNMIIIQRNIEDISSNTTRFLVLSKTPNDVDDIKGKAITTILFDTKHVPGSLLKALEVFKNHNIDLTKLETYMSGPTKPNPSFYVDVGASIYDKNMKDALKEFENYTEKYSILGCYSADDKRGSNSGFLAV